MKLSAEHLCFSFEHEETVLNDISFTAEEGKITAILGPNGAGKTTLLRCMLGFLRPQSGTVRIGDKALEEITGKQLRRMSAYVPQAKNSAFAYTVEETVLLGRNPYLSLFAGPSKEDVRIAEEAMKDCGVYDLKDKRTDAISGGELQLVLIARALCQQPRILILDEPETGLDFRNQLLVLELLESLSRNKGLTIVFNTHYPDHALRIADTVILLKEDGTCLYGKSSDILKEEILQDVFDVNIHTITETIHGKTYSAMIPVPKEEETDDA
ncbi:MAG: ABC transporter ATP-binding protein [Solobacterium sp.]|nr:ABC transporter ATP-binding protein [Solobacterium sp.]